LASLMGIKAKPAAKTLDDILADVDDKGSPRVSIIGETEAKGSRDTGRGGLQVYLLEGKLDDMGKLDRRDI
ncbi:MAG: hypothetical protein IKC98_02810, partial [Firmicutes bacterium]|nr:hypothetical protein [Bacillota bacterium]